MNPFSLSALFADKPISLAPSAKISKSGKTPDLKKLYQLASGSDSVSMSLADELYEIAGRK